MDEKPGIIPTGAMDGTPTEKAPDAAKMSSAFDKLPDEIIQQ